MENTELVELNEQKEEKIVKILTKVEKNHDVRPIGVDIAEGEVYMAFLHGFLTWLSWMDTQIGHLIRWCYKREMLLELLRLEFWQWLIAEKWRFFPFLFSFLAFFSCSYFFSFLLGLQSPDSVFSFHWR